jgi:5,10-methylenetetrahydromethanopterin reductase
MDAGQKRELGRQGLDRDMNMGLTMNPDAPLAKLIKAVQLAESLGFNYCYIGDQGFSREVYVTLSALAGATKRIQLGPGVTHPYTRHPAVAAAAIASLDEFSAGRAFFGVGAGGTRALGPINVERANPLRACREEVEIARLLWSGQSVSYHGEFFSLTDARLDVPCRSDIEVHWAARGAKMLSLGGEIADVVMLHGIPRFALGDVVATVKKAALKLGRKIRMHYAVRVLYDEASRESARARTAFQLVDSAESIKTKLGVTPKLAAELRRLVTTQGPRAAAHLVSDEILRNYVLDQEPEACASILRELVKLNSIDGLTVEVSDPLEADTLLPYAGGIIGRI